MPPPVESMQRVLEQGMYVTQVFDTGGRQVSGARLFYWLALRPAARFLQYYFFRKGFLDGYFGLFYSVSSAYYEWAVASRFLIDARGQDFP